MRARTATPLDQTLELWPRAIRATQLSRATPLAAEARV
jgi:hypothetical protein